MFDRRYKSGQGKCWNDIKSQGYHYRDQEYVLTITRMRMVTVIHLLYSLLTEVYFYFCSVIEADFCAAIHSIAAQVKNWVQIFNGDCEKTIYHSDAANRLNAVVDQKVSKMQSRYLEICLSKCIDCETDCQCNPNFRTANFQRRYLHRL